MLQYKDSKQFQEKVLNFPTEVYRIDDPSTHIFKLMYTIMELGLGQLSGWQDETQNSESMAGTKFTDLDAMFSFTGVTRLPEELYSYDPYTDQLTSDQWNEITTKDALFRIRIMKFFQSMLRGGTLEGVQMMAEAASGVQCQVFEMWRVISGQGLGGGITLGRDTPLNLAKEFVIVPLEDIDDGQRVAIIHLVDLIKPINTVCTVHISPTISLSELNIPSSTSADYFFEVRKMVSASDDPTFQDPDIWIQANEEIEGPTFAGMETSSSEWSINGSVTSIKSYQVDENFLTAFGSLVGSISDSDESIVVDENDAPTTPSFPIKIDDEQMFVVDRVPVVNEDTQFTYTVLRAQSGTVADSHSDETPVNSGVIPLYSDKSGYDAQFGSFRAIPIADSPDNYPEGQYPGDPAKFDSEGHYIYDWGSQAAFIDWFTLQIHAVGGEVVGSQYRLPTTVDSVGGLPTTPEDALAGPEFTIQSKIFPGRL